MSAVSRWMSHWVPFSARTVFYGSISVLLGPFTRERRASAWAMRSWSRSCLRLLRISVDASGLENIPEGAFVYVCNHQSLLDTLILASTLPRDAKWAVKGSLMAIPFLGWHLWVAGHVRVNRHGGNREIVRAIERLSDVLRRGRPLLVFPEGTRSRNGQVKSFKRGVFYAAARAGVPVVPVALHGTGSLMEKGTGDMVDGAAMKRVWLRAGVPLSPANQGTEGARAAELCDRAHVAVVAMHAALAEGARTKG